MKTTNLIPVLGFDSDSYKHAERLCDLLSLYKNRNKSGYILLVAAPNTHPEQHKMVQIAAEAGFEHVGLLTVGWPPADPKNPRPEKYEQVNRMFREAAIHIAKHFKEPFVWLEPDSIPTCADWLEQLSEAYHEQPKLYMAPILAGSSGKCIGRVAVYPRGCATDIGKHFDSKSDFIVAAGESLVNKASKTKLIQHLPLEQVEDLDKIRPSSVVVHGDKKGILLSALMNGLIYEKIRLEHPDSLHAKFNTVPLKDLPAELLSAVNARPNDESTNGRNLERTYFKTENPEPPRENQAQEPGDIVPPNTPQPVNLDKRTKAYRDAKKAALAPA